MDHFYPPSVKTMNIGAVFHAVGTIMKDPSPATPFHALSNLLAGHQLHKSRLGLVSVRKRWKQKARLGGEAGAFTKVCAILLIAISLHPYRKLSSYNMCLLRVEIDS